MRRRVGRGGRIIYDRISIPKSDKSQHGSPEYQEVDYFKKIFVKRFEQSAEVSDSSRSSPIVQLDDEDANLNISLNDIEIICGIDS